MTVSLNPRTVLHTIPIDPARNLTHILILTHSIILIVPNNH